MESAVNELLQAILVAVVPAVGAFAAAALAALKSKLTSQAQNVTHARIISEITDVTATVVDAVTQSYTDDLKKSNTFSPEAQKDALNKAVGLAKVMLTKEAMSWIEQASDNVNEYLEAAIEAQLYMQKTSRVI